MPDKIYKPEKKKKKRGWWAKRTNYGIGLITLAGIIAAFPPATVVFSLGSIAVTAKVVATSLFAIGNSLGVYGIGRRIEKKEE